MQTLSRLVMFPVVSIDKIHCEPIERQIEHWHVDPPMLVRHWHAESFSLAAGNIHTLILRRDLETTSVSFLESALATKYQADNVRIERAFGLHEMLILVSVLLRSDSL